MITDPELARLLARTGRYAGHGIDHEDQPFHGELELTGILDRAVALAFDATGLTGDPHREERSWIAVDEHGRICLWTIERTEAHCACHPRRHGATVAGAESTLVFGRGDRLDDGADRVEIAIDLWPDGAIGLRRAWGRAGEPFAGRSSVRLLPVHCPSPLAPSPSAPSPSAPSPSAPSPSERIEG